MNKSYVWGWVVILSILTAYELYALIFGHGKDWPLTWATVRYCPWYIAMPFLTWLWLHFAIRYAEGAKYIQEITAGK